MTSRRSGWTTVAFGDVVKLHKERARDPIAQGLDRYVGLEHLEPGDLKIGRWGNVVDGTTFTNVFHPGQVLFGKRRAYQRKVAVADFSGLCSGDIYVLKPKDDRLHPELLPFMCQTDSFFGHAVGTSAGSLSPRTNWESLASYEFTLPPLDEQRRIANMLAVIERPAEGWLQVIQRIDKAVQAYVNNHVESLVGDCRFRNQRVGRERLVALERLCTHVVDCLHRTPTYTVDGVIAIRTTDMGTNELYLDQAYRVSESEYREQTKRLTPQPGDILFSREAPMGKAALVPPGVKLCISQRMMHLRVRSDMAADYVAEMLNSRFVRDQIARFAVGSTVPHVNVADVKRLLIPVGGGDQDSIVASRARTLRDAQRLARARRNQMLILRSAVAASALEGGGTVELQ